MKKAIRFSDIIGFLEDTGLVKEIKGGLFEDVAAVSDDSSEVSRGTLFVCQEKGFKKESLENALKKCAVCRKILGKGRLKNYALFVKCHKYSFIFLYKYNIFFYGQKSSPFFRFKSCFGLLFIKSVAN